MDFVSGDGGFGLSPAFFDGVEVWSTSGEVNHADDFAVFFEVLFGGFSVPWSAVNEEIESAEAVAE